MSKNAQLDSLSIRLDEKGTKVIVIRASDGGATEISVHELKAAVGVAGFGAYKLNESALQDFAQTARITAGNGIFIRDFAMQSELTAGHQVVIGDGSRKGHLIGERPEPRC